MSEEKMKILEMLKEGKISAEEAHGLLEDINESHDACSPGAIRVNVKNSGKNSPRGFFGWVFKFIFGLLTFAIGGGVLFGLLYYLPTHLPVNILLIIYGVIAIAILSVTLIAVYAIGVGRLAVKKNIRIRDGNEHVEIGGDNTEKPREEPKQ